MPAERKKQQKNICSAVLIPPRLFQSFVTTQKKMKRKKQHNTVEKKL